MVTKVANVMVDKPVVYAADFGVVANATFTLNGSGVPSSWTGTNNTAALQAAINFAAANNIYKVMLPAGYMLLGSTVTVPVYMSIEGVSPYITVLVPSNSFASGTVMLRLNPLTTNVDGILVKNIGFQMNGLQVANCIALQLYKVNTLTTIENVTVTQMGSSSIGIDIYRGSCVFIENTRLNGGTLSDGTGAIGTNMRVRECPGIYIGKMNNEHAAVGILYENKTDADGTAIYNPTFIAQQLYIEEFSTGFMSVDVDNGHVYTTPTIHFGHVEARTDTVTPYILRVLPYSGTNHNVLVIIDTATLTGSYTNTLLTPTRTYSGNCHGIYYVAGNQINGQTEGIKDALTDNPRIQIAKLIGTTNSHLELHTNAGKLGDIYVDNTTGQLVIDGTNGVTLVDTFVAMTGLPTYADNAAAITGGLSAGRLYKTSTGEVRIRY